MKKLLLLIMLMGCASTEKKTVPACASVVATMEEILDSEGWAYFATVKVGPLTEYRYIRLENNQGQAILVHKGTDQLPISDNVTVLEHKYCFDSDRVPSEVYRYIVKEESK